MGIKKAWKEKTPSGQLISGGGIKRAIRTSLDPLSIVLKKKKKKEPVGMKKGGQVCRGMGAASSGGRFGRDG